MIWLVDTLITKVAGFSGAAEAASSRDPGMSAHQSPLCVCVCVIKLHITAQSGPGILVILCHSH